MNAKLSPALGQGNCDGPAAVGEVKVEISGVRGSGAVEFQRWLSELLRARGHEVLVVPGEHGGVGEGDVGLVPFGGFDVLESGSFVLKLVEESRSCPPVVYGWRGSAPERGREVMRMLRKEFDGAGWYRWRDQGELFPEGYCSLETVRGVLMQLAWVVWEGVRWEFRSLQLDLGSCVSFSISKAEEVQS